MKILNVNNSLSLKIGGGTAERTFQMSRHLSIKGDKVTILTLDIDLDDSRLTDVEPAKVIALRCLWKRFYLPAFSFAVIDKLVKESDIIHLMGHWSILNAVVYFYALKNNKKYIVCPAGALSLFGRSYCLKKIYNIIVGYALIKGASGWIAVTNNEAFQFEDYGVPLSNVSIIPNGVDPKDFIKKGKKIFLDFYGLPNVPFILFMGRLNLIKGPDILLQAYARVFNDIAPLHLVFAGPDGGMMKQLILDAHAVGLSEKIHFVGHISGGFKSMAYHAAKLLVVPSRQEAMSIVAVEAGICGTPVLLTDKCGFEDIKKISTLMEVEATVDGIASGLIDLCKNDSLMHDISCSWKNFVEDNFSWNKLITKYLSLYNYVLIKNNQ